MMHVFACIVVQWPQIVDCYSTESEKKIFIVLVYCPVLHVMEKGEYTGKRSFFLLPASCHGTVTKC